MLQISREVELGLLLMVEMARKPDEITGLKDWAEKRNLPYRYLSKIAVKLKKAKLLFSKEGRDGGYGLAKSAQKIKIGEVVKALEGSQKPVKCLRGVSCECKSWCGHQALMGKLVVAVEGQLDRVSLKDIC
jgi:Rrf2 family protein